jgi:hypothetical protein
MTDTANDIKSEYACVLASAAAKLELLGLGGITDVPFERARCPEFLKRAKVVFTGACPDMDAEVAELLENIISAMKLNNEDVCVIESPETLAELPVRGLALKVVVALGAEALATLTGSDGAFGGLRGRFLPWRGIKVMPTYHPEELLKNPELKRPAWEDIQKVMARLKSS